MAVSALTVCALAVVGSLAAGTGPLAGMGGTAGAATSGTAGKSADQILAAAKKAEVAARGVHVVGTIAEGSDTIKFVVDVNHAGNGQGTFTEVGQSLKIKKLGSRVYVYADKAFWTKNGGAAVARQIGNRWVTTSSSGQFQSLAQFFDISRMTTGLLPTGGGRPVKGATVTVGGQKVVPLRTTTKGSTTKGSTTTGSTTSTQSTTLYVAATGTPYVVKATATNGDESGTITFGHYGEPVVVKAPSKTLNLSQLSAGTTTTTTATTATTATTG